MNTTLLNSYHVDKLAGGFSIRINGEASTSAGKSNGVTASKPSQWGLVVSDINPVEVCCIRYYNRQLTDAEIAHNYLVDKVRFGL